MQRVGLHGELAQLVRDRVEDGGGLPQFLLQQALCRLRDVTALAVVVVVAGAVVHEVPRASSSRARRRRRQRWRRGPMLPTATPSAAETSW
nr:hypothetical protein StreXyl84_08180 [Streptomyces sp. Xyl84]